MKVWIDGDACPDIADILKIPESTAKSRHHRGIKFTNLGSFLILFF